MDIDFDVKEPKPYSQSEINKLKRDLNAENFQNIYNIHSNLEEEKNNDMNNEIEQNKNNINDNINPTTEKINIIINDNEQLDENNINHSDHEIILKKDIDININNPDNNEKSPKKEESKEELNHHEEENDINRRKIIELIPLWFKCLNKDHGSKYISLDKKRENLICKYCFQTGALETNLDINQEFVDNYLKELEEKNRIKSDLSKDIIKETSEENITEKEEQTNKLNKEENESSLSNIHYPINCLTFLCENFPYYLCENCKDFICYRCVIKKMDGEGDKSRHYFHDIDSVNYIANSFKDDVEINLETIDDIINSLDFLINEEKNKNKNFRNKLIEENKNEICNIYEKSFEKIKENVFENNKGLFDKYSKKVYNNKDNDIKDLYISNNNIKTIVQSTLDELKLIQEKINSDDVSDEDKCELHNKYIELIKKANLLIQKGKSIVSQSKDILNHLNSEEITNKYIKEESLQNKLLLDKEKSFIQSLSTSNKNKGSYSLNRFVTYKHEGPKFFGFSTLEFSCNNNIALYGLFLCGKYLSSNKIKQKDFSELSMSERNFYNINVKIYELSDVSKKKLLIDENKMLYEIVDTNDPLINIKFEKSVKINKDEKYLIVIENLEDERYCDIWVGNVHKKLLLNNKQIIKCNNTGLEFCFTLSKDYNSDLNEFKMGIIEGILYGD